MQKKTNAVLIALGCVLLLGGGYLLFGQSGGEAGVTVDSSPVSAAEATFLNLTAQIDPVTFDTSILDDARFKVLRDLRTPIIPESVGRPDPFGPLPK